MSERTEGVREPGITAMLAERVEAGDFPAAVYLVAERGRARFADALGEAVREPERRAATAETIFDLASLTKPLVTGMLLALLVERGAVGLDSPVAERLAQFGAGDKRGVTVRHLLTHTGGFRGLVGRWEEQPWEQVIDAVCKAKL
ncbi:MAG TPA: serine hydrolase domain-containing protein, partial [Pyrinomonadaceae bacterium]